ncbi:MAG TPA: hypothetical protein VGF14_04490 [Alphaproteobacteria bacterium]
MSEELTSFDARIKAIELRNLQVTKDKAWEVSLMRRLAIVIMTYITTLLTFMMPQKNWYIAAFIPVIGYWVSNMSLPWLKRKWENLPARWRK